MSRKTEIAKTESQPLATETRPVVPPACDVYENADEVLVVADLPGVTPDSLNVHLDKHVLSISAQRKAVPQEGKAIEVEYRDCEFRRDFAVPGGIDADRISAELKSGVLWLHLPKSETLKPRTIAVRAG